MKTRTAALAVTFAVSLTVLSIPALPRTAAQDATPTPAYTCEDFTGAMASPGAMMGSMPASDMPMAGMPMGTPMAGMGQMAGVEFDQMYIDMMIPHHASIIAMAQAAQDRLTDERLREIAAAVIATQQPEIAELREYRDQFYGDAVAMPMDPAMMEALHEMMPGMAEMMDEMMPGIGAMMDGMAFQMDTAAQVSAICTAENPDLAFIDLVIPHHQMAIIASEAALERSVHPEMRDFAQRVIAAQQHEIDVLTEIRQELADAASATP
jgi:uncharacterized protein (DUF305 family)